MKTGRILHQQIVQLRGHFLACLGLMMALPIEEAIINLREGEGFYASGLSLGIPMTVAPLLAGLIACANVQADLDDRRYIFWRSKPVGVKAFMMLKYFVGLVVAMVIVSLPVVFAVVSSAVAKGDKLEPGFIAYIFNFLLISLAAYSLCFFCNVLVRKTARAWLIGMAMVCFLLLVPFILPLSFKDMTSDFLFAASVVYFSVTLVPSLVAFVVSLFAASRNWHLQTNLKGLLWTGAILIFLIMLLFTRQVASIKVLDEMKISRDFTYIGSLQRLYNNTREGHLLDVDASKGRIELKDVYVKPSEESLKKLEGAKQLYSVGEEGLSLNIYPHFDRIPYEIGDDSYYFMLNTYIHREEIRKNTYHEKLKKAYLCSYHLLEGLYSMPVSALDLSDFVDMEGLQKVGLRQIEDKLVVFIQDSFAVIQIKADGSLELLDKKVNGLRGYSRNLLSRDTTFKIPLIPVKDISIEERIKLTIDVNYRYYHVYGRRREQNFSRHSLVDIDADTISYCLLNETEISRFDVVKWDDEYISCKFRDERPFTFLEQMFGQIAEYDPWFVQDGKLYAYENRKLLVFDVRSDHIRKMGHFQRLSEDFSIQVIEVLDDGNILLASSLDRPRTYDNDRGCWINNNRNYLQLLKNPE